MFIGIYLPSGLRVVVDSSSNFKSVFIWKKSLYFARNFTIPTVD